MSMCKLCAHFFLLRLFSDSLVTHNFFPFLLLLPTSHHLQLKLIEPILNCSVSQLSPQRFNYLIINQVFGTLISSRFLFFLFIFAACRLSAVSVNAVSECGIFLQLISHFSGLETWTLSRARQRGAIKISSF